MEVGEGRTGCGAPDESPSALLPPSGFSGPWSPHPTSTRLCQHRPAVSGQDNICPPDLGRSLWRRAAGGEGRLSGGSAGHPRPEEGEGSWASCLISVGSCLREFAPTSVYLRPKTLSVSPPMSPSLPSLHLCPLFWLTAPQVSSLWVSSPTFHSLSLGPHLCFSTLPSVQVSPPCVSVSFGSLSLS